jgi:Uma2 family endonuclease
MTATKSRKKPPVRRQPAPPPLCDCPLDDGSCVVIPTSALTLAGFRVWTSSDTFPERGKITFLGEEIIVDMNAERLGSHNAVRRAIYKKVDILVDEDDRGMLYLEGARFVHEAADVSNEPDAMFVLWETFASGVVRDIPTTEGDDWIELEGTPDWLLEIVSPSSVNKDTVLLRARYHRAGVQEYWLVDVRGGKLAFTILIHHPDGYHPAPSKSGWQKSKIFGKQFRLIRFADRRGRPAFRLEMK